MKLGLNHAWEVSEKSALRRRMLEKQREVEDDKLILKKRREFLTLVKQGEASRCHSRRIVRVLFVQAWRAGAVMATRRPVRLGWGPAGARCWAPVSGQ